MLPKPGPTFDKAEAEADIQVKKSNPLKDSNIEQQTKVIINIKKKLITDSYVLSGIGLLLNLLVNIP